MGEKRRRLAIYTPSMRGGGAERVILNLSRGIAERGYALDLVLAQAEGPFLAEAADSVRVVDLKASRVLMSMPALVRYLRHERPLAMLAVQNHTNIIALWARRLAGVSLRLIVSEHNSLSRSAQHSSSLRGRLRRELNKRFYPWADGIVAVSKGVADDLAHVGGIPREDIQVIYNAIVTPELREKAKAPLGHPWFNPGQPPVLLGVGRLTPQKDFGTLIQAFARVHETRRVRLLILGEGQERLALERLVRKLGLDKDVSMTGFVANPFAYMARASIFVLSSRWEGLPTVLIEALCCGALLISTDCPSGPREILADGAYGELVPVGDEVALARAIETTLDREAPRPSHKSWQPFETEGVVNRYIDMLLGSQ